MITAPDHTTKLRNFPGTAPTNRHPCLRCPALLAPLAAGLAPEILTRQPDAWVDVSADNFDDLGYCFGGSVIHAPAVFK